MYHHPRSTPLNRKVYVGGLANNGSVREIGNAFSSFGPLKKVWVARNPPGFAFVEFEDPRHALSSIAAMDGTILCGRRIRVAFANRNSRSSSRGQSANAPTRNGVQGSCYACGERGHYARDCFVHRIAMLGLEDALEFDSSLFDSDDDSDMLGGLYVDEDDFYEYVQAYYNQRSQYDDSSSSNSQESPDQNSRNTAQQQHRNERPQEQQSSVRPQEQRRNDRSQEQHRNDQSQEQCRSNSTPSSSPTSTKTNNASDEVKCVICLDTVEDEMEFIPCGHGFHAKCCNQWLSISDICPVCRTEVGSRVGISQICPVS